MRAISEEASARSAQREVVEANFFFYRRSLYDGRYEYMSFSCAALTGYPPTAFYASAMLFDEIVHPACRADYREAWHKLLVGEELGAREYSILDRTGRARHVKERNMVIHDHANQPLAVEGLVSECVTHGARGIAAFAADESLRQLTDGLPAGIAYVDASGRYRFNNRTYEDWFGYPAETLCGRSVHEVLGEEAYERIRDRIEAALSGQSVTFETSMPCGQSGTRYVRGSYVPHWDVRRRSVIGFFTFVIDITDAKRVETNERRYLLELAHAARLSILGEMTGGLAHELAQPLSAINNYSEACSMLLDRGRTNELGEVVEKIRIHSRRARTMIDSFKRFLRKEPKGEMLDLADVVRAAVTLIEWEADARGVPVRVEIEASPPFVRTDRTLIEQVVLNLLRNALDALQDHASARAPITVSVRARDSCVEVAVRDCGPGLTPSAKAHLFEPFFTTKRDGLGIGLVICRRIIEAHGGKLWAEDNPEGRGALFCFTLPIASKPPE